MKYFLDFEFIHKYRQLSPISVGIVSEDDREFYAVYEDMPTADIAADDWIMKNVMSSIIHRTFTTSYPTGKVYLDFFVEDFEAADHDSIRRGILDFIGDDPDVEIWVSAGGFDFTCFSMTLGTFENIPRNIPHFFMDLNQLWRTHKIDGVPRQAAGLHNALADAHHNKVRYDYMMERI